MTEPTFAHSSETEQPQPLIFSMKDLWKVLWEWFMAFRKTFTIAPGLYYTGTAYDSSTPLVVTANYHLTVWSVWRRVKYLKVRLLVLDTDGINVWCSSGKGRFSAAEILRQVDRYPEKLDYQHNRLQLILPKLSLSGVKLSDLKQAGIDPVIGPVYAGDLPGFLSKQPYWDCVDSRYKFDLADRIFTLLPSCRQIILYSCGVFAVLAILHVWLQTNIWWQIFPLGLGISTLYILLFPVLPTSSFALKGISLFVIFGIVFALYLLLFGTFSLGTLFYLSYAAGFSIFFGLYYTGNSGCSNYPLVKKETLLYMPMAFVLLITSLVFAILHGVLQS